MTHLLLVSLVMLACWDPSMHSTLRTHLCKGLKVTRM